MNAATTSARTARSPYEHMGRYRKALAISLLIWKNIPREFRTLDSLPASVAAVPQEERNKLAEAAAVKSPSDKTWAMVVELIGDRVQDEKRWLGQTEEPRASA